ncbi:MAG: DUF1707 domain-containing protein [Nakamurella sp.]
MHEPELRISDQDREQAAGILNTAVSEGRLTWAEHEQRLTGVYAARTGNELVPLLADLPALAVDRASAITPSNGPAAPPVTVTMSKVRRRPGPGIGTQQVDVRLGAAVLDLRDLPAGTVIDIVANSNLGKVEIHVSPGTRLIDTGTAWLGKRSTVTAVPPQQEPPLGPDSPVVRVSGRSVLGHVRVTIG